MSALLDTPAPGFRTPALVGNVKRGQLGFLPCGGWRIPARSRAHTPRNMPDVTATGEAAERLAWWVPRVMSLAAWGTPNRTLGEMPFALACRQVALRTRRATLRPGQWDAGPNGERVPRTAPRAHVSGHAYRGRCVVTCGTDDAANLCALVHEVAHLATWGHHHAPPWKACFNAATLELTGCEIPEWRRANTRITGAQVAVFRAFLDRCAGVVVADTPVTGDDTRGATPRGDVASLLSSHPDADLL